MISRGATKKEAIKIPAKERTKDLGQTPTNRGRSTSVIQVVHGCFSLRRKHRQRTKVTRPRKRVNIITQRLTGRKAR